MELIHYTNNDDLNSMSKKNDINFRRLSVQIDQRIKVFLSEIDNLNNQISKLEERIGSAEDRVDSIEDNIDSIESDVSSMKTDVSSMKTDVSSMKSDVSSIKETSVNLEKNIKKVKDQLAVPVDAYIFCNSDPSYYYDGVYFTNPTSIDLNNGTTVKAWKRY